MVLLAAGVDAAGLAGDTYPAHFPFMDGTHLIGEKIVQRCMHLTSPRAMAMWEGLCARTWGPTLESVQLFLWGGAKGKDSAPSVSGKRRVQSVRSPPEQFVILAG